MDQASRLLFRPDSTRHDGYDAIQLPRMTLHFALEPRAMMTWLARSHTEIRVLSSRIWLTRSYSVDDYWLRPGDVLHVPRGERIWLSADGPSAAEVSLTTAYARRRGWIGGMIDGLLDIAADLTSPRPR
ncbi:MULTISPECIES: DUF2917 domain-containing protein [Burkholderia]|uniref:DUF2917 domain-containing protein n=1 Tax=Burkholderia savannae TaxID=1637837 RepID=A0ABR5T646_9BURK|nr:MULTISPECIES: DUF2917 domain-containing protein [Burkholderia]KVK87224.1 hypothetical protein WS91_31160 [Burkholderia sp. MSMB1498]KWZ38691.1 hypothetical protein WS72_28160 [Burkholderia savannae]